MCRPWILCKCWVKWTCRHTFPATKCSGQRNWVVLCQQWARNFNTGKCNFTPFSLLLLLCGVTFSALCGAVCFQLLYCSLLAVYVSCARLWYSTDSHGQCKILTTTVQRTKCFVRSFEVQVHRILRARFSYACPAVRTLSLMLRSIDDVARALLPLNI